MAGSEIERLVRSKHFDHSQFTRLDHVPLTDKVVAFTKERRHSISEDCDAQGILALDIGTSLTFSDRWRGVPLSDTMWTEKDGWLELINHPLCPQAQEACR